MTLINAYSIPMTLAAAVECHQAGQLHEAEQLCASILSVDPGHTDALHLFGLLALQQDRCDEAVLFIRRAISRNPGSSLFHCNLAVAYQYLGRLDEATAAYREVVRLDPHSSEAFNGLGNVLREQGSLEEAIDYYQRALWLQPDFAIAHNDLGIALKGLGRFDHAEAAFRSALRLDPNLAEAHSNLGMSLLLRGDFPQGWKEYEWRRHQGAECPLSLPYPLWDGSSLKGRRIFLHAEQGLGDTLQFVRYAALVKHFGGNVIVACQRPLLQILASCPFLDRLVAIDSPFPGFDTYAPLLSLPRIMGTGLGTIPAQVPYLFADADLMTSWGSELSSAHGFKIGIAWQGAFDCPGDRLRSIPLKCFAPVAQVPGVRLFSLQKGVGVEQMGNVSFEVDGLGNRLDEARGAFMDTASVMMNLDLVVTSDTSIAHLAGALGVPVWVALQHVPAWGWLLNRDDSPWYPTMRLFRQRRPRDWEEVFNRIAKEVTTRALVERQAATS